MGARYCPLSPPVHACSLPLPNLDLTRALVNLQRGPRAPHTLCPAVHAGGLGQA